MAISIAPFFSVKSAFIKFRGVNSTIKIQPGASIDINNNLTMNSGRLEIVTPSSTSITGAQTVDLVNATLKSGIIEASGKCKIAASSSDTLTLSNNDYLVFSPGSLAPGLSVDNGATATLYGQPLFSSAIALGNASSILKMQISTPLNQSISGSGKLFLQDNLTLNNSVGMPSLVDLNSKTLFMLGGTYSSNITFSSGGTIAIQGDTTISGAWTIGSGSENYVIKGQGKTLMTLSSSGALSYGGSTGSLTLQNLHLVVTSVDGFKNLNSGGKIVIDNCTITLSTAGLSFATGLLDIKDNVSVQGLQATGAQSVFTYTSSAALTIKSSASLLFDKSVTFSFDSATKTNLTFEAQSSELYLNGCSLNTGLNGLSLASGTLTINDKVPVITSTSSGQELEIYDSMFVNVLGASDLRVNGVLKYRQ